MLNVRSLSLAAVALIGAATLRRMVEELQRDGAISRPTATVLDALYIAHLTGVWWQARAERELVPLPPAGARAAGATTAAVGAAVMAAGMRRFPATAQVNVRGDDELVTGGIYRYSRNPQYTGWMLLLTGVALAHRSPRALALATVYPAVVHVWLPHEEAHLHETFGDRYDDYRDRTRRWLGRPRR